jgi:uncharacterized protein (TIGR02145 family)
MYDSCKSLHLPKKDSIFSKVFLLFKNLAPMKPTTIACFAALILLTAISCKKESSTIQSSLITGKSSTSDDMTDINAPASVKIGAQVWMKKNLNVTHYRNGDRIPQVKSLAKWVALTTGAWCWYNNDSATGAVYGKLYNWYAVNDPRGLAPAGWHIPSDAEWDTLSTYLGNNAGGKLKDTGTIQAGTGLWYAPNTGATNKTGFTGLPGGYRLGDGTFSSIGNYGYWWSSTKFNISAAFGRNLYYSGGAIYRSGLTWRYGLSVRCLRD